MVLFAQLALVVPVDPLFPEVQLVLQDQVGTLVVLVVQLVLFRLAVLQDLMVLEVLVVLQVLDLPVDLCHLAVLVVLMGHWVLWGQTDLLVLLVPYLLAGPVGHLVPYLPVTLWILTDRLVLAPQFDQGVLADLLGLEGRGYHLVLLVQSGLQTLGVQLDPQDPEDLLVRFLHCHLEFQ